MSKLQNKVDADVAVLKQGAKEIKSKLAEAKVDSSENKTRVRSLKGMKVGVVLTKYVENLKTKAICAIRRN